MSPANLSQRIWKGLLQELIDWEFDAHPIVTKILSPGVASSTDLIQLEFEWLFENSNEESAI